ncbi:MAG: hypothetical protein LQ339_004191 [Xanthoria mediterranea]|nr:MAG: hypothetical protein LQ339_004191 [Xanthoria mediterranea]
MGTTSAGAAAPTTPVNTAEIGAAHEVAFYRGSFWARQKSAGNTIKKASKIRQLPYFNVTQQWQYPVEVYAEYTPEEEGFCTDPPPQCIRESLCAGPGRSMDHELGERERARRWDPHDDILQEINEEEEEDGEEGNGEFIGA